MLPIAILVAVGQGQPIFDFDLRNGLTIRASGVPIVSGAGIQYYEDGWKQGYYSTNVESPTVRQIDADTLEEKFAGYGGMAVGTVGYRRSGNHLKVHYDLKWLGDHPAKLEITQGLISAEAVQGGTLSVDGKQGRSPRLSAYASRNDMAERRYGPDGTSVQFDGPLVKLAVSTSSPSTLFDARGYAQDYADGKSVLWFGELGLDISKEKPLVYDVDWVISPNPVPAPSSAVAQVTSEASNTAVVPEEIPPLIIPRPTSNSLRYGTLLELNGKFDFPAGHVRFWEADFLGGLNRRFAPPTQDKSAPTIHVDGGVSKLGLHAGGFQITITATSISVLGEEDEGLHNGLRTLAQIAVPHNGRISLPLGYLGSNPQIKWRGVHLFVGPQAQKFQQKLWERVLLPLGFNKAVLQCERTQWDSVPSLRGAREFMTKTELAELFTSYRSWGVDPIPLIQSFGHMDWLFEGGNNADLAVNPNVLYTIDPRKPKAQETVKAIWEEAFELLKPSTIHIGCDEVDMLGFPPNHTALTTELWQKQIPFLGDIAKSHGSKLMLWGDIALAPSEAIDAHNGESKTEAAKRRAAIPKGSIIADWHYKADSKIENFLPSLRLWKDEGFMPIACPWYQPENVRSLDLAADVERLGTLQTTWCGYFSNEQGMVDNFNQFSAMVLAADYSWSTRYDRIANLGYDPAEVFRRLYFGTPRPVSTRPGTQIYQAPLSAELSAGDLRIKTGVPLQLRSLLSAPTAPTSLVLPTSAKGTHLALAMDALDVCDSGEAIAKLVIDQGPGKSRIEQEIRYGRNVATSADDQGLPLARRAQGLCILEVDLPFGAVLKTLKFESVGARGGLRIHGITVW